MILHIVTFRWKDDVMPEDVASLTEALGAMAARIPELRSYVYGANLGLLPKGADYGVAAIVDDVESLTAYMDSPAHAAVYESHFSRMVAERSAVQLPLSAGDLS